MSPFTIFDLVNMVLCAGGIPVFSDVEKKSLTINYENITKVYNDDVAAIIITHTHLINADIDKIKAFTKKKNILLIEDHPIAAHIMTDLAEQLDIPKPIIARHASEAFRILRSYDDFDLILVDQNLPDRTGTSLIHDIRHSTLEDPSNPYPIYVLSASNMPTSAHSGISSPSRSKLMPISTSKTPRRKSRKISMRSSVSTSEWT